MADTDSQRLRRFTLESERTMHSYRRCGCDETACTTRVSEIESELVGLPPLVTPKPVNGMDKLLGDRPAAPVFETRESHMHLASRDSGEFPWPEPALGDSIR